MRPTRAAWLFVAGIAWLVLRGILARSIPALQPERVAESGGLWLLVPLLSVVASLTIPLFFISFLRRHDFAGQPWLLAATRFAVAAATASFLLVTFSYVGLMRGTGSAVVGRADAAPWLIQVVPMALVLSLIAFLLTFARQSPSPPALRRAAMVAAAGAVVPALLMAAWMVYARAPESVSWWPEVASSLPARLVGLAGAAALVWFLESFATSYPDGRGTRAGAV